jgi:aspartate oxidase
LEASERVGYSRRVSRSSDARADVLVVGSGGAGMSAALAARAAGASVSVVTKSALGAGNTGRAQGGIQAAIGDDDSPDSHYEDTFAAGHRAARPELVRGLTAGGPDAVAWLESLGVAFSRDEGRLRLLRCGGASRKRLLQAGERTGAEMVKALRQAVRASGAQVREATTLAGLEPRGDGWVATLAPGGNGERATLRAGAVVLAAGGGLRGEADALGVGSTNHPDATPEVLRMALDLGAEGREVDSWQRHPTGSVWPEALAGYALPETTRGYGATLHDAGGERFVDELAPRDVVAQGIIDAVDAGRGVAAPDGRLGVWLDTTAIDRENGSGFTADRLAYVHKRYLKAGVDITRERVLVYPVLHYRNGGVAIDERAATTLPGLFAAGEIAGGVHGSNRLMGNSLLDTVVYGRRAGASAAEAAA